MNISSNEIHLWYVYDEQINDSQILTRYNCLLNEKERAQYKRFYFEKHRHQYLITRALVRIVLSFYVNEIRPEKWQFKKNQYGKPFIFNTSLTVPLRFNISHSDKLVVMAVTVGQEVGVDVEYLLRPGNNILDIAERFFAKNEVQKLFALPPEYRTDRFFDLWTLGEAYIKACGMGLSIPLNHFSHSFPRPGEIAISFAPERDDQPEKWQFWQIRPNDTHKVSLAIKNDEVNNTYSISGRTITPLVNITEMDYPIVRKTPPAKRRDCDFESANLGYYERNGSNTTTGMYGRN